MGEAVSHEMMDSRLAEIRSIEFGKQGKGTGTVIEVTWRVKVVVWAMERYNWQELKGWGSPENDLVVYCVGRWSYTEGCTSCFSHCYGKYSKETT